MRRKKSATLHGEEGYRHVGKEATAVELDDTGSLQGFQIMVPSLFLNDRTLFGSDFQVHSGDIHVLVAWNDMKGHRSQTHDSSTEWLREFLSNSVEFRFLPNMSGLESFVTQPLPVRIRAKKKWLDKWNLSPGLQEKMFVVDETAPCMELKSLLFGKRSLYRSRSGHTESAFHRLWSLVLRCLLDFLFQHAHIDRDWSKLQFVLNGVCIFSSEEKSPVATVSAASKELCSKFEWVYGNVPYVFGCAASGYNTRLIALHRGDGGIVKSTTIQSFNLNSSEHRFEIVLAMLNIALLFQAIVDTCPASGKNEFTVITRSSGVELRLYQQFVEKSFPNADSFDRFKLLYDEMERNSVPNVERLMQINLDKKSIVLAPRGMTMRPANLLERLGALRDVLHALVALHRMGWIHRDICWSNVMRQQGEKSWFLIDFAEAATYPQSSSSAKHLSVEEHAPEMFVEDGIHATAVDVWAVGLLIKTSLVQWQDSAGLMALYEQLVAENPTARPTAQKALAQLVVLEEAANREHEASCGVEEGRNCVHSEARPFKRVRRAA